jgi:hypothetical protein
MLYVMGIIHTVKIVEIIGIYSFDTTDLVFGGFGRIVIAGSKATWHPLKN